MTVSPRLTRAAFAFLLFGTAAALLPAQNTTALAENGCFTGPTGTTGQFAIAPAANNIQQNYPLISTGTKYYFFYKTDSASAYQPLSAGVSTTFTVNSGQVVIGSGTYSTSKQPPSSVSASFTAAQVITRNSSGTVTGYAAGSVTVTSTYVGSSLTGHQDTYTAIVTLSAPASTS